MFIGISSSDLIEKIRLLGKQAIFIKDFNEIAKYIKNRACPNDIILTMGAGTVNEVAKNILI